MCAGSGNLSLGRQGQLAIPEHNPSGADPLVLPWPLLRVFHSLSQETQLQRANCGNLLVLEVSLLPNGISWWHASMSGKYSHCYQAGDERSVLEAWL
jgi:hypothetical protein